MKVYSYIRPVHTYIEQSEFLHDHAKFHVITQRILCNHTNTHVVRDDHTAVKSWCRLLLIFLQDTASVECCCYCLPSLAPIRHQRKRRVLVHEFLKKRAATKVVHCTSLETVVADLD